MKNIITNLYNGNYSLAKTYWIFGIIGSFIVRIIVAFPLAISSTSTMKIITYILVLPSIGYLYVTVVGLIKSSRKYEGWKGWKYLAYISLAYHIVIMVFLQILISVYETTLS
ncbi:MAG: hypothetical protein AGIKBDMD_00290 [Synergistaceae bacterium]